MTIRISLHNDNNDEELTGVGVQFEYTHEGTTTTVSASPEDETLGAGAIRTFIIDDYDEAKDGDKLSAQWRVNDDIKGVVYTYRNGNWISNPEQSSSTLEYGEDSIHPDDWEMDLKMK